MEKKDDKSKLSYFQNLLNIYTYIVTYENSFTVTLCYYSYPTQPMVAKGVCPSRNTLERPTEYPCNVSWGAFEVVNFMKIHTLSRCVIIRKLHFRKQIYEGNIWSRRHSSDVSVRGTMKYCLLAFAPVFIVCRLCASAIILSNGLFIRAALQQDYAQHMLQIYLHKLSS